MGETGNWNITIKNTGMFPQSNYTVKLMKSPEIELDSINVLDTLYSGNQRIFSIDWTPIWDEVAYLYGKVELEDDEFSDNNETHYYQLNIYPSEPLSVLLWDNDNDSDINGIPTDVFLENALQANNILIDKQITLPLDLSVYDAIFVALGVYCVDLGTTPPGSVGAISQTKLNDYMDSGHPVNIEGSDFGYSHQGTSFINHFGCSFTSNTNQNIVYMEGIDGTITEGYNFDFSNSTNPNYSVDEITPTTGTTIFISQDNINRTIINETINYRTICSTPVLGGFLNPDAVTKVDLLRTYLGFLLDLDGYVRGMVTDTQTGEPIENVNVTVGTVQDTTNTNGMYNIEIEPGIYELNATHIDYEDYTYPEYIDVNSYKATMINFSMIPITAVDDINTKLTTSIKEIYPNPCKTSLQINYYIKYSGDTKLEIYNLKGQKVKSLLDEYQNAGNYSIPWQRLDEQDHHVSQGIYFLRLKIDDTKSIKKIILIN